MRIVSRTTCEESWQQQVIVGAFVHMHARMCVYLCVRAQVYPCAHAYPGCVHAFGNNINNAKVRAGRDQPSEQEADTRGCAYGQFSARMLRRTQQDCQRDDGVQHIAARPGASAPRRVARHGGKGWGMGECWRVDQEDPVVESGKTTRAAEG